MLHTSASTRARHGSLPLRLVQRLIVLGFAVIQAVLVGRILLDLGVIPAGGMALEYIGPWSDALAAPVASIGSGLGGFLGGGGVPGLRPSLGQGLNPAMLVALAGWSVVEGLTLGVVRKFAAV